MIFVRFTRESDKPMYFVGASLEAILADTKNGTDFGGAALTGHTVVDRPSVEALRFDLFESGVQRVQNGCQSYLLGSK